MTRRQRSRRYGRRRAASESRSGARRSVAATGLAIGAAVVAPAISEADDHMVTNTTDCVSTGTADCGSLREEIRLANLDTTTPPRILFASVVSGTITLGSQLPDITKPMEIDGPGPSTLTVHGDGAHGIFDANMTTPGDPLSISGLKVEHGRGVDS